MAAVNLDLLFVTMIILRRRRRRRQLIKTKARIINRGRPWVRPTNIDRNIHGAFYTTFLVAKESDRLTFFK